MMEEDTHNHIFCFVQGLFMKNCFREARPLFNLFLIARADPYNHEELMKEHEDLYIIRPQSLAQLDRKELEEYFS